MPILSPTKDFPSNFKEEKMKNEELSILSTQELFRLERNMRSRMASAHASFEREEVKSAQTELCYIQRELQKRAICEAWPRISTVEENKLVLVEGREAYEKAFLNARAIEQANASEQGDSDQNYPEYEGNALPENVQNLLYEKLPAARQARASVGIHEAKYWNLN